jgi:glycosyltransferase involved in cell wall biosynthesis
MLATLEGVGRAGFQIAVAAPGDGPLAEALHARGIDVEPFLVRDREGTRRSQGVLREELAGIVSRHRPAVVHANSLAMGRLSGPVVAEMQAPSISHLRDIIKLGAQAVADLNRHTRLLAVSRATRDFHVAQGLLPAKVDVLYNGLDLARFCPRQATGYLHQELGLPREARLIGTIGQIGLRKGLDVLAQAAIRIADELADVHFLIVGERHSDKAESQAFEAALHHAAQQEIPGRLHFLGRRDDVPRLLNELTLLVHPARQEPLGRVLLEAAASGVAVVATDVGGTPEIFPPASQSARLVPPGDAEALIAAIRETLGDEPLRTRIAAAARRRAEEAFDAAQATRVMRNPRCGRSPDRATSCDRRSPRGTGDLRSGPRRGRETRAELEQIAGNR